MRTADEHRQRAAAPAPHSAKCLLRVDWGCWVPQGTVQAGGARLCTEEKDRKTSRNQEPVDETHAETRTKSYGYSAVKSTRVLSLRERSQTGKATYSTIPSPALRRQSTGEKQISGCPGLGVKGGSDRRNFLGGGRFLPVDCGGGYTTACIRGTHTCQNSQPDKF